MPSTPAVTVEVFFDLSATGGVDVFTLNDPVRGLLDDVTYVLADEVGTDVTSKVTNTISVNRGRQSQLFTDVPAGRWSVMFNNEDRTFDPLYASSPYAGDIVPGKRCRITANGIAIADGNIDDWNLDYDLSGRSVATAECADGLAQLAAAELSAFTATAGQRAGERINAVLNRPEVLWPANRSIDTGVTVLQGDTVNADTNALEYLQLVARSDLGVVFADRNGVLTFRDRYNLVNKVIDATFADDGTGIPYVGVSIKTGSDLLYNRVVIEREGGTAQVVDDATSQAQYRVRTLSESGLLMDADSVALDMANYLLHLYDQPLVRIDEVEVELAGLTTTQQAAVLNLDLQSLVAVTFTPNGIAGAIERELVVEGIQHTISPASHRVRFTFGDTTLRFPFILDDPNFGQLDDDVLAF